MSAIPVPAPAAPSLGLFNDPAFHALGLAEDEHYVRLDLPGGRGSLCGRLAADGTLLSGAGAPYGGLELTPADGDAVQLAELLLERLDGARDHDAVRTVRVRARPACHGPAAELAEEVLGLAGFAVEHEWINQHVDLTELTGPDDHLDRLPKKRRYDVRRSLADPAVVHEPSTDWPALTQVIDRNRAAKGRPAWLSAAYLARVAERFDDRVAGHLLRRHGEPVAAAVVYAEAPGVRLLVAWGDLPADGPSPMPGLAHRLVREALADGARVLDLGISSEPDGSPNEGLIHFKRGVGARAGVRRVYLKELP